MRLLERALTAHEKSRPDRKAWMPSWAGGSYGMEEQTLRRGSGGDLLLLSVGLGVVVGGELRTLLLASWLSWLQVILPAQRLPQLSVPSKGDRCSTCSSFLALQHKYKTLCNRYIAPLAQQTSLIFLCVMHCAERDSLGWRNPPALSLAFV